MKYLKKFERKVKRGVDIGDYVIMKSQCEDEVVQFVESNIGQIVEFREDNFSQSNLTIKYEDVPYELAKEGYFENDCRYFSDQQIVYISKNKEDLEHYITSKKYNL